jgi:hypothetical protein
MSLWKAVSSVLLLALLACIFSAKSCLCPYDRSTNDRMLSVVPAIWSFDFLHNNIENWRSDGVSYLLSGASFLVCCSFFTHTANITVEETGLLLFCVFPFTRFLLTSTGCSTSVLTGRQPCISTSPNFSATPFWPKWVAYSTVSSILSCCCLGSYLLLPSPQFIHIIYYDIDLMLVTVAAPALFWPYGFL